MDSRKVFLALVALALAPLAHGHGFGGTPKQYCEHAAGDLNVHEYGGGDGVSIGALASGHDDGCMGDWTHFEFADGGAIFLAHSAHMCSWDYPDHPDFPHVSASDVDGGPVRFWVYSDTVNNIPPVDPNEPNCGDREGDFGIECVDTCHVGFPPGLDGTYLVFVEPGHSGHVWTGAYEDGGGPLDEHATPLLREGARYRAPSIPPPIPCVYGCP